MYYNMLRQIYDAHDNLSYRNQIVPADGCSVMETNIYKQQPQLAGMTGLVMFFDELGK